MDIFNFITFFICEIHGKNTKKMKLTKNTIPSLIIYNLPLFKGLNTMHKIFKSADKIKPEPILNGIKFPILINKNKLFYTHV